MSSIKSILGSIEPTTKTKGKRIFNFGYVTPGSDVLDLNNLNTFIVKSENDQRKKYKVEFNPSKWETEGPICACPQHLVEEECKHVVACLFYLDFNEKYNPEKVIPIMATAQLIASNELLNAKVVDIPINNLKVQISKSNYLDNHEITKGMGMQQHVELHKLMKHNKAKIISHDPQKNTVTFEIERETIKFNIYPRQTWAVCTCKHNKPSFCIHTRAILLSGYNETHNPFYIRTFADFADTKKALLQSIGFKEHTDEVNELFEFYFEHENLKIRPKKDIVFNFENSQFIKGLSSLKKNPKADYNLMIKEEPDGYVMVFKITKNVFSIDIHSITGTPENPEKIKAKLNFKLKSELVDVCPKEADLTYGWSKYGKVEILREKGLLSNWFRSEEQELLHEMSPHKWEVVDKALLELSRTKWPLLINNEATYLFNSDNKISVNELKKLSFNSYTVKIGLKLVKQAHYLSVISELIINEENMGSEGFMAIRNMMFIKNDEVFLIHNFENKKLLDIISLGIEVKIVNSKISEFLKDFIFPIKNKYSIEIPDDLLPETYFPNKIQKAVTLKELEPNYFIIEPIIMYDDFQIGIFDEESFVFFNGKTTVINREIELENEFGRFLQGLHPDFENQSEKSYFYLTIPKVIQNHWFFDFYKALEDNEITVFGQKDLKKLRFNSNRPKLNITGGSGIDWFDIKIELSYGDEIVPLKLLKSAIINKQDFITLSDGSLGILPEEWIKKFSTILKIGNTEKEKVRISKLHFGLLDAAEEFIQDKKLKEALAEKKKALLEIDKTTDIELPKNIKAKLRPYQLAGFQWFNKLYQIGWGGCLADDMGLGKTLQTLAFIRHIHNQKPRVKTLVVCPTSLMYNWQAEALKFTPDLRSHIYHSLTREIPKNDDFDLFITSYGTFRNDLEKLKNLNFEICILDESQAIKNPRANVSQAVCEINTPYRYILSGTPLQNNTFDLFSQFNFINPGLLGNQEFFKDEFSTPIDKYGDSDKSQLLRKMIYPFMLRRTKEQVAKDLPEKTESIIYCEMESYQRKVYESLKNEYRDKILGKIAEEGVAKSAFLILEGLNKLRMACDCPSLIKDEDTRRFKSESVKLNELVREMDENAGHHKVLIFSQFLGMLALIKDQLELKGIKHLYLDGNTAAKDRQGLVDSFQNDADIKVFLISLKAGGVGLNLTAADYVYIVDPWWNPAVEDQAIDRTHRIGQKNNIFAYKLICKDTIEEKIHQLQQKKKKLAKEIVSEEASFIKKLTKDDVEWLLT